MKNTLMILIASCLTTFAAQQSFACRILPSGDSSIRINALHSTLAGSEQLTGFTTTAAGDYQLEVYNLETNSTEIRTYRLKNTSPMCPVYKAIRIN